MAKLEPCSLNDKKVAELKMSTATRDSLIASVAEGVSSGNLTTFLASGLSGQAKSELLYRSPNINETMYHRINIHRSPQIRRLR
jgi:hypothetical protein